MCRHESKKCPRCQLEFECKVGNILQCQCTAIQLTDAQIEYIGKLYSDCLCINCLRILCSEAPASRV